MKKVDLIGVQMDFGAGTRGVNMGPAAIRFAGLVKGINGLGLECLDKGDLIPPQTGKSSEKLRNYEQVNYINKKLFEEGFSEETSGEDEEEDDDMFDGEELSDMDFEDDFKSE